MLIPLEKSGSPKKLIYTTFNTPFGITGVAVTPYGICRVVLSIQNESKFVEALKTTYHSPKKQPRQLIDIEKEFHLYFSGKLKNFSFNPDLRQGTNFQRRVWKKLTFIPFGETRSYQQLANQMNRASAVRAVASACGRNRHALLIPCHRVVRSDGTLGGYRWQLDRKARILAHEQTGIQS